MTIGNPSAHCFANAPWRAFTWTCALLQETSTQPWGSLQEAVQESLDTAEHVDLHQLPGMASLWSRPRRGKKERDVRRAHRTLVGDAWTGPVYSGHWFPAFFLFPSGASIKRRTGGDAGAWTRRVAVSAAQTKTLGWLCRTVWHKPGE